MTDKKKKDAYRKLVTGVIGVCMKPDMSYEKLKQ